MVLLGLACRRRNVLVRPHAHLKGLCKLRISHLRVQFVQTRSDLCVGWILSKRLHVVFQGHLRVSVMCKKLSNLRLCLDIWCPQVQPLKQPDSASTVSMLSQQISQIIYILRFCEAIPEITI
eukprot:Pompholyxophrys_punicea_v1_NODE_700_length_1435_cov_1.765942.p2 type:complete len:122 gc:universal NODE_700_length_1435_cov_1.765942:331-696(+)